MQPNYRVSVTTLEKFRRFMADTSSFDTEQALLDSLTGAFEGTDKTRFGTAFHAIIEHPHLIEQTEEQIIVHDRGLAVCVPRHIAAVAVQHRKRHPLMICEISASRHYTTGKHIVKVSGRVDGLEGAAIRDAKTKYRAPDVTEYQDSMQWKFYLDMLGLKVFYYDIFEVKYFNGLRETSGILYPLATTGRDKQPRDIQIVQHEPIPCYGYLSMHTDCLRLVTAFMEWVEFRNLFHLLKQDGAPSAVPA